MHYLNSSGNRLMNSFSCSWQIPNHSYLRLKQVGPYWAVRVGRGYRALARRRDKDFFWFWIGSHDEYDRLIDR